MIDNYFWSNFVKLCNEHGTSPNAIAKELGISSGSVTGWKNGAFPRDGTLIKIAVYFNVSTDYLLGKTDQKEKPTETGEIQAAYDHAPDEIKAAIRKLLDL